MIYRFSGGNGKRLWQPKTAVLTIPGFNNFVPTLKDTGIVETLPLRGQFAYACGMLGWSVLTSTVAVMLVYFYQPPEATGLVNLIPKIGVLGIINAMTLIMISSRIWDAVIDPVIAWFSDRSRHKMGRRILFMRWALLPVLIAGILLFIPATKFESTTNIWWLAAIQILFNLCVSIYIIPYNAMLPELGHTSREKLRLSTYQNFGFVLGWIIAATGPGMFEYFRDTLGTTPLRAFQMAIWINFSVAVLFMAITAFGIREKKYCLARPAEGSLLQNLIPVIRNKSFFIYLVADFTYFISITTMSTGALYYVTVLLNLPESMATVMILVMVVGSWLWYPAVNWVAQRYSKKLLVLSSLIGVSLLFLYVFFLGRVGLEQQMEAIVFSAIMSLPLAMLGILPPVILAEITHLDAFKTRQNKEATYFAIRSMFIQFGQTLGLAVFTILIGLDNRHGTGKILEHWFPNIPFAELGIRLSGIFGASLCLVAALIFMFFNEKQLDRGIAEMEKEMRITPAGD